MTAPHYIPGTKFGRLVILERRGLKVLCRCDCGNEKEVVARSLKYGTVRSCGCFHREQLAARNTTHGMTSSRTYNIWSGVVTRCTNPNRREYKWYGGAGISLDPRWLKFENFLADMGEAPTDKSIDRKDPRGDYCKTNCYWATDTEQSLTRTDNHLITIQGQTKPLTMWAREAGIKVGTLKSRVRLGWVSERLLKSPRAASASPRK